MSDKRKPLYIPKERRSVLLRVCSWLFTAGTCLMWIFKDKFEIQRGDLLIMSGIAVLLVTLSMNSKQSERRLRIDDETLRKIQEEIGKDNYNNNDIYYK
ncbi:MAG: hypothetical protein J1E40_12745 [Oscillospiraceae bacterium]|nr:hypothetical protein [Oscillospiraceae bacterium]